MYDLYSWPDPQNNRFLVLTPSQCSWIVRPYTVTSVLPRRWYAWPALCVQHYSGDGSLLGCIDSEERAVGILLLGLLRKWQLKHCTWGSVLMVTDAPW
jgi:hypothetical protein